MPSGGGAVAASDLRKCFAKFDKNGSGSLSFDELLAIMTSPLAKIAPLTAAEKLEAKENFERYDLDGDGTGRVSEGFQPLPLIAGDSVSQVCFQ